MMVFVCANFKEASGVVASAGNVSQGVLVGLAHVDEMEPLAVDGIQEFVSLLGRDLVDFRQCAADEVGQCLGRGGHTSSMTCRGVPVEPLIMRAGGLFEAGWNSHHERKAERKVERKAAENAEGKARHRCSDPSCRPIEGNHSGAYSGARAGRERTC